MHEIRFIELLFFFGTISIFIAWFYFGVIVPAARAISHDTHIKYFTAFLLISVSAVVFGFAYDFGYYDIVDGRTYSSGDTALETTLVLVIAPLILLWALYETILLLINNEFPIFCALVLASHFFLIIGACKLKPKLGILAALTLPPVLLALATYLQAPSIDRKVFEAIAELEPDCAEHTPFFTYIWNRSAGDGFHTYVRKGDEYFNWSYELDRFVPIPNSRISNASKCHKRL